MCATGSRHRLWPEDLFKAVELIGCLPMSPVLHDPPMGAEQRRIKALLVLEKVFCPIQQVSLSVT